MMWTLQGFSHKLEILYIKLYFYHKSWAWHASALTLSLAVRETREQQMSWCTNVGMKRIVTLWRVGANVAILIMLFRNPQAFITKLREHFQLPLFIVWHMWESKPRLETGIISRARDLLVWYPCLILTDLEGSFLSGLTRGRHKNARTRHPESLTKPFCQMSGWSGCRGNRVCYCWFAYPAHIVMIKAGWKSSKVSFWTVTAKLQGFKVRQ